METALVTTPAPSFAPAGYSSRETLFSRWIGLKKSEQTRRAYRHELARFLAFLETEGVPFERVVEDHIARYMETLEMPLVSETGERIRGPLSPSARARALSAIKSLYKHAQAARFMAYNPTVLTPIPDVTNNAPRRHALSEKTVQEMVESEPSAIGRAIIATLAGSGLRVSELCALRWKDVFETGNAGAPVELYVQSGKGGKDRNAPLHFRGWNALQAIRPADADPEAFLLTGPRGGRFDPVRVFRLVRAAAQRIGLSGNVSPHWLRHTFATTTYQNGAPLEVISKALGHSSIVVTHRTYVHFNNAKPAAAYLK